MAKQQLESVLVPLQMIIKVGDHNTKQFPEVAQIPVHIGIRGCTDSDRSLHQPSEAPKSFVLVVQFDQKWCQQVRHSLGVP